MHEGYQFRPHPPALRRYPLTMPPPQSLLQYAGFDKPIFPYRSNSSPTDDTPHFIQGSQNVLATIGGTLQKRQGFSDPLEVAASTIPGKVVRLFAWKRWAGSATNPGAYIWMACAITGSTSTVWKYQVGTDASFSLLWTDAGSATPFDFQDSNNFVFFGNATTRVNMRKFDSVTCSLWGLDAPISAPNTTLVSGALPSGLTFNSVTGVMSGTPTASGATSITVTATDATGAAASQLLNLFINGAGLQWVTPAGPLLIAVAGVAYTKSLAVQSGTGPYAYTINSGALPAGLSLSSTGVISGSPTTASPTPTPFSIKVVDSATIPTTILRSFSIFVGSAVLSITPTSLPNGVAGTAYSQVLAAAGGTGPYTYALVSGGIPAGLALASTGASAGTISGTPTAVGIYSLTIRVTDAAAHASQFVVPLAINSTVLAVTTTSLPNAQVGVAYSQAIAVDGGTSPYIFSYAAGSLTAQTGYFYGYTYTSVYGHESSMSPLSRSTGLFTDQDVGLDFNASTDPQVNGINVYRTTDGGDATPSSMKLTTSLSNATESYLDFTQDIFLGLQNGPALYVNNPPQPMRGLTWSNGRIWGFKDSTTWFTGNEEVINGIPAECMSNAKNGNFYGWPTEVGALAVTDNGVNIALSEEWWQVSGDAIDTFRKSRLLKNGGTTSPTCTAVVGNTVYWIDTAKQAWSSDRGEFGQDVRPDLANIDLSQTFIVPHKTMTRDWLCILDAANGIMLIYDFDLGQWQTPWTVASSSLASGQTTSTAINLIGAFAGNVRKLSASGYNDNGVNYPDQIRTGLYSIVPGSRTTARNPTEVRQVEQFELEMDTAVITDGYGNITNYAPNQPSTVYAMADDDPKKRTLPYWIPLGDSIPLQFDAQYQDHIYMAARRWVANYVPPARRVAMCAVWNASPNPWMVYSIDLAWRTT